MSVAITVAHRASAWLLLAYALLALIGAVTGVAEVRLAALSTLVIAVSLSLAARAGLRGWLLWLGWVALLVWLTARGRMTLALDMVPVIFNAALCAVFALTLRRGHEPLVVRIIRVMEGSSRLELAGVRAYARRVTLFWALLLGLQAAVLLLLWLLTRPGGMLDVLGVQGSWMIDARDAAWYEHLGVYLLPVLAMLAEHRVRRMALRHISHLSLAAFGRRLFACWPRLLREAMAP